jgi:menaquinone-9 beta-reductase
MHYDVIVIGGGIAGSSVAIGARRVGLHVLVLEAERIFRDRIRGEGLHAWGVREARQLGIADLLYATCARSLPLWDIYVGGQRVERRDLRTTTAASCESMAFFHPHMQEVLLGAAERAGARVHRGARVVRIEPGTPVRVEAAIEGAQNDLASARLVVVAAGRASALRSQLGLDVARAGGGSKTTGVLLENVDITDDAAALFFPPSFGMASPVFPLPDRRARLYFVANPRIFDASFAGTEAGPEMLARCEQIGVPRAWLEDARIAGPLATFDGTPTWAVGAWPEGVALIGDAAGSLDPALGAGLSLALFDARMLTDRLGASADLAEASRGYERERAAYYARLLRLESCVGRVLYGDASSHGSPPTPALLPRLRELGLDVVGGGPGCRIDDDAERALFGARIESPPGAGISA